MEAERTGGRGENAHISTLSPDEHLATDTSSARFSEYWCELLERRTLHKITLFFLFLSAKAEGISGRAISAAQNAQFAKQNPPLISYGSFNYYVGRTTSRDQVGST
uniref:Uncharacterized protein n=1 Tax=Plectus sambesii TaxID=2011161 RepID=A0A914WB46_9BILA